jgi:hypothetical protein
MKLIQIFHLSDWSDITTQTHSVPLSAIFVLDTVSYIINTGRHTTYLRTEFHIPGLSVSPVAAVGTTDKGNSFSGVTIWYSPTRIHGVTIQSMKLFIVVKTYKF